MALHMNSKEKEFAEDGSITHADTRDSMWKASDIYHEKPEFKIGKVNLPDKLQVKVERLLVANNIMYILNSTAVFRIDLNKAAKIERVPLPKEQTALHLTNAWVHPNGQYLIIQINSAQYYHLHLSYSEFKYLGGFKGMNVTHIAFSKAIDLQTSGEFLLATKEGVLYVSSLKWHNTSAQSRKRDERAIKQVFNANGKVNGIRFTEDYHKFLIFLEDMFMTWDCGDFAKEGLSKTFKSTPHESRLPGGTYNSLVTGDLQFYYVYHQSKEIMTNDEDLVLNENRKLDTLSEIGNISSMVASEFHLLFLSEKGKDLIIRNKLNPSEIEHKHLSEWTQNEKLQGLTADTTKRTYWIYTTSNVYEIAITNESCTAWYNYYKAGNFGRALKLLDASDQTPRTAFKRNVVLVKQGYDLLQAGGFGIETSIDQSVDTNHFLDLQVEGIKLLADLEESFEKVSLMILGLQLSGQLMTSVSNKLLLEYLTRKYERAKASRTSKIKLVVLSAWIVRLHLRIIQLLNFEGNLVGSPTPMVSKTVQDDNTKSQLEILNSALDSFLKDNYKDLDPSTLYLLFEENNFHDKLIFFAELLNDYEFILHFHLKERNWSGALKALVSLYSTDQALAIDLIYRTSSVLLMNATNQIIDIWLKLSDIDYEKLLPAILNFNKQNSSVPWTQNKSIQFLQKLIYDKKIKSRAINNCYLSLLISYPLKSADLPSDNAITKMLAFVKDDESNSRRANLYDASLLLRLCLRFEKHHSAILILTNDMGLYEVALNLALSKNLTNLGELILRKYDELILRDAEDSNYDFIIETTATVDTRDLNKIKLGDDHFASRKRLWIIYARYLIEGVCKGNHCDVLNGISDDALISSESSDHKTAVQNITSGLLMLMHSEKDPNTQNAALNRVMHYLLRLSYSSNKTSNVLTLKDLLPLFPESIMISKFKDEIVESLNHYNARINQLSAEMKDSADIAQKLKLQIQESELQQNKGSIYTIIEPGEACLICEKLLVDRNFMTFPNCHHSFHNDCAIRYYLKLKGDYRFKKIYQNFKKTNAVENKNEVAELLLKECLFCNDSYLNSVEDSLVSLEKMDEMQEWNL